MTKIKQKKIATNGFLLLKFEFMLYKFEYLENSISLKKFLMAGYV